MSILKRFGDQGDIVSVAQMVGDDVAIKQVFDHGQISPASLGADIGDVSAPFLVGPLCLEVALQ